MMMMMHHNNVMHHNNNMSGVIDNNFHYDPGMHRCFQVGDTMFEVEAKYMPTSYNPIGRGAYGVVCSSVNTLTFEKVAIKKINVLDNSEEALKSLRELRILRHVRHPNVIALQDVMIPSPKCKDVYLVFELMKADLGSFITEFPLSNDLIKYFMFQLVNGLSYLHSSNIIHRDLKPGNLLLNANYNLKICDFGLATTTKGLPQTQPATEYVVTRWYRAPELLLGCATYGPSIDIWSVGCIFAELLGGKPLFQGKNKLHQVKEIIRILGTPDNSNLKFLSVGAFCELKSWSYTPGIAFGSLFPEADWEGLDLLSKMLQFDPNKRITAAEALQHPYLRSMYYAHTRQPFPYPCAVDVDASVGVDKIRKMIWDEMLFYHPEAPFY